VEVEMAGAPQSANRALYDRFWKRMPVTPPRWFSTWDWVGRGKGAGSFVEIGPGTRPRSPLDRTCFLDLSVSALRKLRDRGARGGVADGGRLPLRSESADVLVAFDVLEHVERDGNLFREIGRVVKPGGRFLFSVPLHPELFDRFDEVAGHVRRYEPEELVRLLREAGFRVQAWTAFGTRPRAPWLNRLGAYWMERFPAWCAWTRDLLFRFVGRHLQAALVPREGELAEAGLEVAGVFVKAKKAVIS